MKIFILEDNPLRIETFRHLCFTTWGNNLNLFIATNVDEAKDILKSNNNFDISFLDHDLGGDVYVPSEHENTGYQLAKFIQQEKIEISTIIIHSHNPNGSKNIFDILTNSTMIPFAYLIEHWNELFNE